MGAQHPHNFCHECLSPQALTRSQCLCNAFNQILGARATNKVGYFVLFHFLTQLVKRCVCMCVCVLTRVAQIVTATRRDL